MQRTGFTSGTWHALHAPTQVASRASPSIVRHSHRLEHLTRSRHTPAETLTLRHLQTANPGCQPQTPLLCVFSQGPDYNLRHCLTA